MPVEGAVGESGTATHRLANRAQRRAGDRRAPGSRSQNTGTQGQAFLLPLGDDSVAAVRYSHRPGQHDHTRAATCCTSYWWK